MFSIYQIKVTLDTVTQLPLQLAASDLVDAEAPALQSTQMSRDAAQGIISPFVGLATGSQLTSDLAGLDFAPPYSAINDCRVWTNTAVMQLQEKQVASLKVGGKAKPSTHFNAVFPSTVPSPVQNPDQILGKCITGPEWITALSRMTWLIPMSLQVLYN